jgi:hypothetical protein
MKTLNELILGVFVVFMFIPKAYSQDNADPGIGILMSPPAVVQNITGVLSATVGNYGNLTIAQDSLRLTISVGANAEIIGIDPASDARWSQLTLTAGSANTIRLTNTGDVNTYGGFNAFDVGDVLLTVRGNVGGGSDVILGNIVYIAAENPLLCGGCASPPLNTSQGNASFTNDNSSTSLTVTTSSGELDLTPVMTIFPSSMVGPTSFEIFVQVIELLDADTSGTITVRIPKDDRWSLTNWDSFAISLPVSGNVLNNSIWTFSEDASSLIFTTDAKILAATQSNFGFTALWSSGQTRGVFTASVLVIPGSGAEVRTDNNTDAEQASYSFE